MNIVKAGTERKEIVSCNIGSDKDFLACRMTEFFLFSVKEQLAHDPDNEVATTSLKVSLCCPVSSDQLKSVGKCWE